MKYINYCLGCGASPCYEEFGKEVTFVISEETREDDTGIPYIICRFYCKMCKPYSYTEKVRPSLHYYGFRHREFLPQLKATVKPINHIVRDW